MTLVRAAAFALLLPAGLLLACSSSSEDASPAGGADAGASAQDAAASDATTGSDAANGGDATADGSSSGACTNAADIAALMAAQATLTTTVGTCATTSLGDAMKAATCVQMATGLSAGCSACFGDSVACVVKNCLGSCALDARGMACTTCRATNCDPAFDACSGLPPQN